MIRRSAYVVALSLCALSSAQSSDSVPKMNDYAWGFPIQIGNGTGLYSVELPLVVYQSATDSRLRDAGVYNADGKPVPRIFRRDEDRVETRETTHTLQMLPLYSKTAQPVDDIRMLFSRGDANAELSFDTNALLSPNAGEKLTSYVIDARKLDDVLVELEFAWTSDAKGFIGNIIVDGSENLVHWSQAGSGALADLEENQSSVRQSRLQLSGQRYPFFRVRWTDMPDSWQLTGINGISRSDTRHTNRRQMLLQSSETDPKDGGRIFDIGGEVTIDQLRVVLPERNSIISGTLYYWSGEQKRWLRLIDASFDNLEQGTPRKKTEPMAIGSIRAGRFKLVSSRSGAGTEAQLEVGWRPDTLVFLAQGAPPFMLAVGNAADEYENYPQQRLFEDWTISDVARRNGGSAAASLGPRFSAGGESRLAATKPVDWNNYLLWFALALGVSAVGFMALRLIRDMKSS